MTTRLARVVLPIALFALAGALGCSSRALPPPPEPAAPEVSGPAAMMAAGLAERSRQTLERVRREGESMSTDENDEFSPLRI